MVQAYKQSEVWMDPKLYFGYFVSLTLCQMSNFRLFQTERICISNDKFKFDENDKKFSNHVKNTVGVGEIAC